MSLAAGTRLGPYEIQSPLGAGGMGEVYRACDTKLGRDVAIKVVSDPFVNDPERLARFQREAQVLASLNHPNIGGIYGLEDVEGVLALVLELVEGPTLADRIAQGPVSIDEALPIARQIAEALEAAHEQGIVHRDLKPANIKLRPDGRVKVLDFGLAKALDPASSSPASASVTNSPTITSPAMMTGIGVILGTAAYMSPEQAKGRPAGRRSDIWAFGCVFYEMLSGKRAFEGEDVSDTLAAVLRGEPDWRALPAETPTPIRRLLGRCLDKDPRERLPDIGSARLEIRDALVAPGGRVAVVEPVKRGRERLAWIAAMILAVIAAVTLGVATRLADRAGPAASEMRVDIQTPPTTAPGSFALSPDGSKLVFVATDGGQPKLWLRSLDDGSTRVMSGSEGAGSLFWSPNSRSIGFFGNLILKRIDLIDGSVRTLSSRVEGPGYGATWNRDDVILFASALVFPLSRVSAVTRGEPVPVTRIGEKQRGHTLPQFLPDGQHFLYQVSGEPEVAGVYLGALDGTSPKHLLNAESGAVFTSDHLLFIRQGVLFAQAFDSRRLELTGEPFRVADPTITRGRSMNVVSVSASMTGAVAFRATAATSDQAPIWFDRAGKEVGRISDAGAGATNPDLSADGQRLALTRMVNGKRDVWTLDLARGVWNPATSDATSAATAPVWARDGRWLVYTSPRQGSQNLYMKLATSIATEELLLASPQLKKPTDVSPDGQYVMYQSVDPVSGNDIWALPLQGNRKPVPIVQTRFNEGDGQFSPDGKWIVYQSDESGRFEIYAKPFQAPGDRIQISTNGGAEARWRRDGRELFYVGLDERLMAVQVRPAANGQSINAGSPSPLFLTHIPGGAVQAGGARQQYAASADGQRFLIMTIPDEVVPSPITLILNWKRRP